MGDDSKDRLDAIFTLIKETATRECWPDDPEFMVYDYCGGNIDDAYAGGRDAGEVMFARLLQKLVEGE